MASEPVEGDPLSVGEAQGALCRIDPFDRRAEHEVDAALRVPLRRAEADIFGGNIARQQRRQERLCATSGSLPTTVRR